ncbi:zinc finger protein 395a [Arapaima gigas]
MNTSAPKSRLGKRTPLGVLVSACRPPTENVEQQKAEGLEGGGHHERTGHGLQSSDQDHLPPSKLPDQQQQHTELSHAGPSSCPDSTSTDSLRRPEDFNKMAAAMALVSLACEPVVIISSEGEPVAASWEREYGVGDLSGANRGSWTLDHCYGISAPSSMAAKNVGSPINKNLSASTNPKQKKKKPEPSSSDQQSKKGGNKEQRQDKGPVAGLKPCPSGKHCHSKSGQNFQSSKFCPQPDLSANSAASSVPQSSWSACTSSASPTVQATPEQCFPHPEPILRGRSVPSSSLERCTKPPQQLDGDC